MNLYCGKNVGISKTPTYIVSSWNFFFLLFQPINERKTKKIKIFIDLTKLLIFNVNNLNKKKRNLVHVLTIVGRIACIYVSISNTKIRISWLVPYLSKVRQLNFIIIWLIWYILNVTFVMVYMRVSRWYYVCMNDAIAFHTNIVVKRNEF